MTHDPSTYDLGTYDPTTCDGLAERVEARGEPQRAGLRIVMADHQPTGAFVAVEMAILVLVTALAMVAVIVAGGEDDASAQPAAATQRIGEHGRSRENADPLQRLRTRSIEEPRAKTDIASR